MVILTHHALVRMQQRGIPEQVVELLHSYGRVEHVQGGAKILYLDKKARKKIERSSPSHAKDFQVLKGVYTSLI